MAVEHSTLIKRQWLAATMVGAARPTLVESDTQTKAMLDCAIEEGVVTLVHEQLLKDPGAFPSLRDTFATAARNVMAVNLFREAECRRMLNILSEDGIPALLLKGSALAWWLYPASYLRECGDIDLLFSSRAQAQRAVGLMAPHGYVLNHNPDDLSYELMCRRTVGSLSIDLDIHWRLVNAPMFAGMFEFNLLQECSIPLPRLAANGRGLDAVHAFLHACVHRAVNLHVGAGDKIKWLYDLHLLALSMCESDWATLQRQCDQHGLNGICVKGIETAAELFGNAVPGTVLKRLRDSCQSESLDANRLQDWKYMQRRNFAALPTITLRTRWLWQRLFPPIGHLQELYGTDRSFGALWIQRAKHAIQRLRS